MDHLMYERFTDRARKVMQLANQEAQRFNHEYIGTEHILLGLAKEGSGTAANALKNLNIDLRRIRAAIEASAVPGPDMVTMGKLPQDISAKRAVEHAMTESRLMGHNYVGTEHVLIGLAVEPCVASTVLASLGASLAAIRKEIGELLKSHPEPDPVALLKSDNDRLRLVLLKVSADISNALQVKS